MKKIICVLILFCAVSATNAGNSDKEKKSRRLVCGKISNFYGESVPAAMIFIPETGETHYADIDGRFKFEIATDKVYTIQVNTIGYAPFTIKSSQLTFFSDLSLKEL